MVKFIDTHKDVYGAEPIFQVLPIALSTYYVHKARARQPQLRSERAKHDEVLSGHIKRVWHENFGVYGARKVWQQLLREGVQVARCTIERLMGVFGLSGSIRGKRYKVTTLPDESLERPNDLVKRDFTANAPNQLWVADITFVPVRQGFAYTAFVIDAFSCKIVGWSVSRSLKCDVAMDALEQAICERDSADNLVHHHSDRGVQYLSIRYTDKLEKAGIAASVGSVGDSYDNALTETINGLYKTELIRKQNSWENESEVEYATMQWVHWYNNRRLYGKLGNIPPTEYESLYGKANEETSMVIGLN